MTEIGVVDMAKLPEDVREKLEELDLELAEDRRPSSYRLRYVGYNSLAVAISYKRKSSRDYPAETLL
ncbi:hypothetical protein TKK_0007912 [Trichogramma kaykai]